MKFYPISEVHSDCMTEYSVENYKANTVKDFIEEVLKERSGEYGKFRIEGNDWDKCIYKYGEITKHFNNKEILKKEVFYITSSGGYGLMDYVICTTD